MKSAIEQSNRGVGQRPLSRSDDKTIKLWFAATDQEVDAKRNK